MRAAIQVAAPVDQQGPLDAWLARSRGTRRAVIAECGFAPLEAPDDVPLARLAPGCVCCVGQVPLRVTVTRTVRAYRPDEILLLLASAEHLARVRALLADGSLGVRFDVRPGSETTE
jgi:hypothetical protein